MRTRRGCLRTLLILIVIFLIILVVVPFLIPINAQLVVPSTLSTSEGQFVTARGIQTYVVAKGPITGKAVLLIHGLFGSTYTWRKTLDGLAKAGYRAIAYDRPPYGLTDKPDNFDYSSQNQAAQAAEVLDRLGIQRAVIVGHSAGAPVAVQFALTYPERIDRLVIVDGSLGVPQAPAFVGPLTSFAPIQRWLRIGLNAYFDEAHLRSFVNGFYAPPYVMSDEDAAAYYRAFRTEGWDTGFITQLGAQSNKLTDAQIAAVNTKTLLIWGEKDTAVSLEQGKKLVNLIPGAELEVIDGAGHQPMEESPVVVNRVLVDWLARQ